MKLPKKVTVGALVYRLSSDRATMNAECRNRSTDLLGQADHRSLVILIEPRQAPGQQRDTLLHEVMHAIFNTNGLAAEWGEEKEEAVVLRTAPVLLDVLRRNPKLVAALLAGKSS